MARVRKGLEVGRALLLPWWSIAVLGVLLALVLSLVVAPAAWLDWAAMRASDGRLRLQKQLERFGMGMAA